MLENKFQKILQIIKLKTLFHIHIYLHCLSLYMIPGQFFWCFLCCNLEYFTTVFHLLSLVALDKSEHIRSTEKGFHKMVLLVSTRELFRWNTKQNAPHVNCATCQMCLMPNVLGQIVSNGSDDCAGVEVSTLFKQSAPYAVLFVLGVSSHTHTPVFSSSIS